MATITLDRSLQNRVFQSWRLGKSFIKDRRECRLPGPLHSGAAQATDYLHVRASVLRNHLLLSQGRLLVICHADNTYTVSEVVMGGGDAPGVVAVRCLAGMRSP